MTDLIDGPAFMELHGGPWVKHGEYHLAYCPAHADGMKHGGNGGGESLSVSGRGVIQCHAGCSFKEIMDALRAKGRTLDDSIPIAAPTPIRQRQPDRLVREYGYTTVDGEVVGYKGRFEGPDGKRFIWRRPDQDWSGGSSGLRMAEMPLYNTALVAKTPGPVYFVEGEKAADACTEQGLVAVTGPGGSSQKEFGSSLEVLRGRTVHLWADNDAPGAAYMAHVKALLNGLGCTIFQVTVPLGPKEDAFDYFARGGEVKDLESVDPRVPVVTVTGEDSCEVRLNTPGGPVILAFSEMEKSRRKFECKLDVRCFNHEDNFEERLNLDSNSGTTQLRRDLDSVFGKDFDWVKTLNKGFNLARESYLNQERGLDIADAPDSLGEVFLMNPLLPAGGPTIFFGDGGSFKSYITAAILLAMYSGLSFCGVQAPGLIPLVLDWEDTASNTKRRWNRLAEGMGLGMAAGIHYWDANGISLPDQVDAIKRYVLKHGIGLLVIDSVAPACGGDVLDSAAVLEFFRALKAIGLPSILIAHVTKSGDTSKPFGSTYWHNEARRTWYVARETEEESDEMDVALFCRKVNDGPMPKPLAYHISFSSDLRGPVRITRGSLDRAGPVIQEQRSSRDRVWAALGGQPRTIEDLSQETGLTHKAIDSVLQRGPFAHAGYEQQSQKGGRPRVLWARAIQPELSGNFGNSGSVKEKVQENPLFYE